MRYIVVLIALFAVFNSSWAQTDSTQVKKPVYSVRHSFAQEERLAEFQELEPYRQRHLFLAGEAMQKSTGYLAASVGSAVASGVLMGVANRVNSDGGQKAMYITGGVLAGVSLICLATTIKIHMKAGRELKLSAGEVVYKF